MNFYQEFLRELDSRLEKFRVAQQNYIVCKEGCSSCCESGDYPLSRIELEYLMQGFISLDNEKKAIVQSNVKNMVPHGICPFLIDKKCSVYPWRPIVCRVHGLAYLVKESVVKVPYCVNEGKNFSSVYQDSEITVVPIKFNLDTQNLLKEIDCGEILYLYDWLKNNEK